MVGLAVGHSHVQRAASVAKAATDVLVARDAFTGRHLHLTVHAAHRGQEVADGVVGADQRGGAGTQRRHDVEHRARAVGAERIEDGVVPERRRVIAAQADFTETTHQADGRTALPVLAATGRGACTVVIVHRAFEPEAGTQAAAEVFGAAEAEAVAVELVGGQQLLRLAAVLHTDRSKVDDAEQSDRRLGRSHTSERGQRCQGKQRFFHCNYLLGCSRGSRSGRSPGEGLIRPTSSAEVVCIAPERRSHCQESPHKRPMPVVWQQRETQFRGG